jgi:hypothetical protein
VRVPSEAGSDKAKITLSFPSWKEGRLSPVTVEVPIVEPEAEKESKEEPTKSSK